MSTYENTDQNSTDIDNENVSREELQLRLELAKLDIVKLRDRITTLEKRSGIRPDAVEREGFDESLDQRRRELSDKLQSVEGDR